MKSEEKKKKRPERGIETMFRIAEGNQQSLSNMADNKAHILITVNAILLSVVLSVLLRKIEDNPNLLIPSAILLCVNLSTLIFSILATRPRIPNRMFTHEEVREKETNLLFFGNFYQNQLNDYTDGMYSMMENSDYLYKSMIKDVHTQGVVLSRKYRLLRIAYTIFMFGIVISVISFVIASVKM